MENEYKDIDALIKSLGIGYTATFIPQSKSRNAKEKYASFNWIVTISKGTHSSQQITTDYMQGIGYAPKDNFYAKNPSLHNKTIMESEIKLMTEGGVYCTRENQHIKKKLPAPALRDVLCCLVSDACVIDAGGFENWASDMGMDTDSRKAEKLYKDCLDIAIKLRAMLGNDNLVKIQEAFQRY